jgi:hypothetical protein
VLPYLLKLVRVILAARPLVCKDNCRSAGGKKSYCEQRQSRAADYHRANYEGIALASLAWWLMDTTMDNQLEIRKISKRNGAMSA